MKITEYTNINNESCVMVEYDDGTSWSGLKTAWDELNVDSEGTK